MPLLRPHQAGWLPAAEGTTPKVSVEVKDGTIVLETNTDVAMEMPTPQYGKNAVVWGMYLISQGLGDNSELQLKKAADGISDLFFQNCVEGEAISAATWAFLRICCATPTAALPI